MLLLTTLLACPGGPPATADTGGDTADSGVGSVQWVAVGQGMSAAPLSVWGTGTDDVWLVGSDAGAGPIWVHYDGGGWTGVTAPDSGDLWWVWGLDDTLYVCGWGGRIFRYDLATGTVIADLVDVTTTLYGIWPGAANDVWAVGGNPDAAGDTAKMFHFDGAVWSEVALPADVAAQIALFKIWGSSPTDVWAVGSAGTTVHFDGIEWSSVPTGSIANLFTINGRYAVGGNIAGTILAWVDGAWVEESPAFSYAISGVWDDGANTPIAAGQQGEVYFRGTQGWEKDERERATLQDLHSVYTDPEGGVWAVGGHVSSLPLIQGVLIYAGSRTVPKLEGL